MNEMVERVADAIEAATLQHGFAVTSGELARAALKAMREPTEEMKAALEERAMDEIEAWRAMVDAALSDKKEAGP